MGDTTAIHQIASRPRIIRVSIRRPPLVCACRNLRPACTCVGGSHNSLVINMRDYLIAFDAPVNDWQSNWTIRTAQAKYGNKPVRYLMLTHHHMDHAGGLRVYLAQGATLVVGRGAAAHYRRVLATSATRNPDLGPRDFSKVNIVEVSDKYLMSDGRREVSAIGKSASAR